MAFNVILSGEIAVEAASESIHSEEVGTHADHACTFVVFDGIENLTFLFRIAHWVSWIERIGHEHALQRVHDELLVQFVAGLNLK